MAPKCEAGRKHVTVDAPHDCVRRVTQLRRALGNRIEHRLKIGWRTGDHPQDVASRSELFQRFVAFPS